MQKNDGMNYAPQGSFQAVCQPGEFIFAAAALDHGHIYGMCNGLREAGGQLKWVYDPDPAKVEKFVQTYPEVRAASSLEQILQDDEIKLVAAAAIPSDRGPLGLRVMDHGKDYFTDKAPFTTLEQLEAARRKTAETGRKYAVYYSERLHVESAIYAGQLIEQGAIGRVVQVIGMGPHRINAGSRPGWFFEKEKFGGILCDIGSHQIEQFLYFTGAKDAKVVHSKVANYNYPEHPGFEDFGDATLIGDNGATGYFRVDWMTPDGLSTWGDGRLTILGTDGYIELRKYVDIARDRTSGHVYLVNHEGEHHFAVNGKVGFPYFGQLILDCLNRTETAMTQEHAFKAAELCLIAQRDALQIKSRE
ncbi:Gfo/Idh/MocA family oxidoreductase [Paenibacillus doosanensis]|uniref:Oxidoreductase n=1 Tax=Paenibacillus konkukensis TaxID=2020716 RepID=A0ABY4RJP6_9BACL|nr:MULTISPECIES: Gfo/Idh/MocA family oxidoreductase [Paenibacillus]MCS7462726.1 Gfo/Idh/MocA family oxidoreductase [Paenibacillus doosanensis]UQZ82353.1 putative oxidoreductase [Paenibacillus konkukensis]